MGRKTIVVTTYGKDESIESISICLFDKAGSYYSESKEKPPKLDILNKLHDRSVQRVLQEVPRTDLARALMKKY
jgi:flagellar motor switch protein FliG